MILSAQTIRERRHHRSARYQLVIEPFSEREVFNGMSYGLSVAGYDLRIRDGLLLEPHGFALATTIERFEFPHDVLGVLADKSTWARRGLAVQNTIFEPGWRGYPTIELTNHNAFTLAIEPGMPIGQMIFHKLDRATDIPYTGKYQDQKQEPTPAKEEW